MLACLGELSACLVGAVLRSIFLRLGLFSFHEWRD